MKFSSRIAVTFTVACAFAVGAAAPARAQAPAPAPNQPGPVWPKLSAGEREVTTQQLGELVMRELKKLDKVAYIRFASVYRNFEDVDAFSRAIREVSPAAEKK